ncbi:NUDIX domain-containing protein [Agrobacterium tumefaciens]|uniref:NUDIX hydrolase n=1 Tax=Agrobacterium tumefaciens TaxID=358 RepID=A0AA44F2L4_AGRTU|nr:NUDIX hydrolase [Agrobacterium tumefaciens]AYM10518.1 hydrolase [Agrobacterium tumefaciens]NSL22925.1 NUDIX hydrolase [Agrobacterium tumefaciens]NSY89929.1 NUDIX hydrolase [Agrobacterium tumefaciens]NTB84067.1 NUDIX hydrolase [Agrobacterium tumefaciens]NTC20167.1 NUDIX hydrolase [Agrobacterium tumefaciens]
MSELPSNTQAASGPLRPRDAASIILFDRSGPVIRVLMGRRSNAHIFMPGAYVFPGGKRDPRDHALPFSGDLHPAVLRSLTTSAARRLSAAGARALALAAARELVEETGVDMGMDADGPDLSRFRYVARAITPPGNIRRYDTRFFCCYADELRLDTRLIRDSDELHNVQWLDMTALSSLNMPKITRTVLEDVTKLMIGDPSLPFESPARLYVTRHGRFIRDFV